MKRLKLGLLGCLLLSSTAWANNSSLQEASAILQAPIKEDAAVSLGTINQTNTIFSVEAVPSLDSLEGFITALEKKASTNVATSDTSSFIVAKAQSLLGVPYKYGGTSVKKGFDCSGLVQHVFKSAGLFLPRVAAEQGRTGQLVASKSNLKAGDLVFFNTRGRAYSHVGIYVGDNKFIHAPRTGDVIKTSNMSSSYWTKRFNGARRIVGSI